MSESMFSEEISAFHAQQPRLLKEFGPSWVIMVGMEFKRAFPDYQQAIEFAIEQFGDKDFLIRHTEERAPHIPLVVVEAA